ncbi:hypothetical protein Rhe02_26100 [Rhizocola hellebori]|uniref:Glycosyltransferase 2-like domain-containing protein n=1 Tax=Rhizocola hellebori TaxID=1392758 RepID=A0A8J3VG65_9ACTN|nr:glycosyltransferase family 2 protein [Rhizocola hellebori]GIH04543.1 hypothetical protein Rhe02_26100 [Rhizocola hellebori]
MNSPSDIAAVILNWNCAQDTLRCVRAVASGSVVPQIVVVDNGSHDSSVADLSASGEGFSLVRLDRNLGYAGGMNAGIHHARDNGAKWVWLLNADSVPSPSALENLAKHTGDYSVLASLQVTSADPADPQADSYLVAARLNNGRVRPLRCGGCDARIHEVDVVTGASLFADADAIARAGMFDERFFHYKEEFDLVRRIALDGGRVGLACGSKVWHQRGGSLRGASPRAQYYLHRNELLYVHKHYPRPVRRMLLQEPSHYLKLAKSLLGMFGSSARRARSLAVFAAYWDGMRGVTGPTNRFST